MLRDPKVRLSIKIEGNNLLFEICNNKPAENHAKGKGGIGLKNVKKRLALLYPGKNLLKLESTETTFSVKMNVTLEEKKYDKHLTTLPKLSDHQIISYANV